MILEHSWRELTPQLKTTDETIDIKPSAHMVLSLSPERHCTGFQGSFGGSRTPCMRDRTLPAGKLSQCEDCKMKDVSFAAKTGFGGGQEATELLKRDHYIYLALFSEEVIKVGVSVSGRQAVRTHEQGATACMYIGKGNGTEARNNERKIHTLLGFTEWVRASTKLEAMAQMVSEDKARELLAAAYKKVIDRVGNVGLDEPEFHYWAPDYGLSDSTATLEIEQITAIEPGAHLEGTVSGMLGKLILVEADSRIYALDTSLLAGYDLVEKLYATATSPTKNHGFTTKKIDVDRQQSLFGML